MNFRIVIIFFILTFLHNILCFSQSFLKKLPKNKDTTSLDIQGTDLENIPPELTAFNKLTRIDLLFNKINNLENIHKFKYLKKLNLGLNKLNEIPAEIGQLDSLNSLNIEQKSNFSTTKRIWSFE